MNNQSTETQQQTAPTHIPYGPHHTRCTSCSTTLLKLKHERTGNYAPIEADPSPKGNCLVDVDRGTYRLADKEEREAHTRFVAAGGSPFLRLNHYATCPNAAMYHRGRGGEGWRR